jgi:hypothetical protein
LGFEFVIVERKMTAYFREQVLRKRSYLNVQWCLDVVKDHVQREVQSDGRIRFWGYVAELPDKALRVVTLEDGETLHNAFPDSGSTRRHP